MECNGDILKACHFLAPKSGPCQCLQMTPYQCILMEDDPYHIIVSYPRLSCVGDCSLPAQQGILA